MVRVANADKTETKAEQGKRPQGQEIGFQNRHIKQLKKNP